MFDRLVHVLIGFIGFKIRKRFQSLEMLKLLQVPNLQLRSEKKKIEHAQSQRAYLSCRINLPKSKLAFTEKMANSVLFLILIPYLIYLGP